MVLRLGVRPPAEGLAGAGYRRVLQGQALTLHTISDAAVTLRAWIRVVYDDGSGQLLTIPEVVRSGSRVAEALASSDVVIQNGWVVNAEVEMLTSDIKRGQTYVRMTVEPFGAALLSDYCFSEFGHVSLGTFVPPGPAGGSGHLHVVTVKAVGAPAANTAYVLVLSNSVRKIMGLSWFYASSGDAATRNLDVNIDDWLGIPPSGMVASTTRMWRMIQLVLTASQDGTMFADEYRSGTNDAGTIAFDSEATPFPMWISEDQDSGMFLTFDVANSNANDEDAIYLLAEDWVYL